MGLKGKLNFIFLVFAVVPILVAWYFYESHAASFSFLWMALLTLLGAGAAAFYISQRFLAPVEELEKGAQALEDGDLEFEIKVTSEDEFGELANAFNQMRRQVQEKLSDLEGSEARFKGIIDTAQDGVVLIDSKGIIQLFNPMAEKIFGYSQEDVIGKNVKMLMPSPYTEEHDGYLKNYVNTGNAKIIGSGREVQGKKKDGTLFPLHLSISEVRYGSEIGFAGILRDLTELNKVQKEIVDSEARFKGIIDTAQDGMILITSRGTIQLFNPMAEKIFGYEVDEVMGKNVKMLMPSPHTEGHDGYLEKYLKTGNAKIIGRGREIEGKKKDGTLFPLHLSISEIRYGGDVAFAGILRDLTEFKKSQDAVLKQTQALEAQNWLKNHLSAIITKVQGMTDMMELTQSVISELAPLLDAGHGTFYLKEASEDGNWHLKLYGSYAHTERKNLTSTVNLSEGLVGQCAFEKKPILLTKVPSDYIQIQSSLGEQTPYNVLVTPILFEEEVIGVVELASFQAFSDIQSSLLQQLVSSLGVVINNSYSRRQTEKLLQESQQMAEELQSQSEELRVSNEELAEKSEEIKTANEELITKSKALEESNAQLEEKQEVLERQKQNLEVAKQEVERTAREVERASRYKSEFLANMSHELRTPLNSLLILAKMFVDNEDGNLSEDQVESAQVIYDGGQSLATIINDILDLSKVEAGKLSVHLNDIDLQQIVTAMQKQFAPMSKDKQIPLNVQLAPDVPQTIKSDRQRIEQILRNLLSNAFKFTEKGSITLSISLYDASQASQPINIDAPSILQFAVIDTGIGIAENQQQAIFEAFQQIDGSTKRKYGGTGLGLTISRSMSALLGGEVHMHSVEGKGSTFTLYLPETPSEKILNEVASSEDISSLQKYVKPASAIKEVAPEPEIETQEFFIEDDRHNLDQNEKIMLIIEDDPVFAKNLMTLSRQQNYKCLVAGDGKSALALAHQHIPDAILLDLTLPDMDGMDVMNTLKKEFVTQSIPIHVISGRDEDDVFSQGASGYDMKPLSSEAFDALFSKLEKLSNKHIHDVLVIEDDEGSQIAITKLIQSKGIAVDAVGDAKSAYDAISEKHYDCAILDLGLPDMNKIDLLKKINESALHRPAVVVYTGRELTQAEHQELSEYVHSIVIKGSHSEQRLLNEVTLFLKSVDASTPKIQRQIRHDPKSVFKDKKVLLVDDDMRNIFAISKILQSKGLNVIKADNGELALEKLKEHHDTHLVIMDIMMPIMDGYEAMRQIRAQPDFKQLPIIALTAKAMTEDRDKCIQAGANDYLTKPVDTEQLLAMMQIWLFQLSAEKV